MTIKTSTQTLATASMALLLALGACHKDENPADPNTTGTPVPLCATASLPGAEGDATVTRTATATARDGGSSTRATGTVRIQWDDDAAAAPVSVSLGYAPSGGSGIVNYKYTLEPDGTDKRKLVLDAPVSDKQVTVIPGEKAALTIDEVSLPLQTVATGGDATTRATRADADATASTPAVPFSACVKYDAATLIGAGGSASLPLQYTTYALRLILHLQTVAGGKPVLVNSVSCPLTMANPGGSASDKARKPTATSPADAPTTQQTVIFGRLAPVQELKAGTLLAILNMADGNALSVSLPKATSITAPPAAGQMLTINVHVSSTLASIGSVSIVGFTAEKDEDATEGKFLVMDGLKGIDDPQWDLCKTGKYTDWIVTGGGTETINDPTGPNNGKTKDEVVLANVRAALDAYKSKVGGGADGTINLTLSDVVGMPKPDGSKGAFYNYKALRSISAPEATDIGERALSICQFLASISLPKATDIGKDAFSDCFALTSINLPEATNIGETAFYGCTTLETISLPKATDIGFAAFVSCTALTSVSLPEAKNIGQQAFNTAALTSVSLPKATKIGDRAFYACKALETISLPKAKIIESQAFRECGKLIRLVIPSVTAVSDTDGLHTDAFLNFDTSDKCTLVLNPVFHPNNALSNPDAATSNPDGQTWRFRDMDWLFIQFTEPTNP